jgi:uncharacterized membrane protein
MAAFGIQQLSYGSFARWVARLPAWVPAPAIWPYLTGAVFVACAAAILSGKQARTAALVLSAMILAFAVLLNPFEIAAHPAVADLWGRAGKAFALSGAAALVAGSLRAQPSAPGPRFLESLIPLAPFFVSAFFCIGGVEHFLYAPFVEQMIPAWMPVRIFWTYFTGTALLAGGIGMVVPKTSRPAGLLSGSMVLSWVVLLHIPRALADLHKTAETTAIFEALAISGAAFLIAAGAAHASHPAARTRSARATA